MIPKELVKKIRYIQIYTSKAVNDVLAGEYHSIFKGQGMEFDEVREYVPGDDVRSIDWNVTARMGKPFIKRYVEERELTIMFLVDLSSSGDIGSVEKTKNETAAEICALLAFSAIKNNDKVGLIIFTDHVEKYIPPRKGTSHVMRMVRDLLAYKPEGKGTDIASALDYLGRVQHKKAVVFLMSDFQDKGFDKPLQAAGFRHDLILFHLSSRLELSLPEIGLVEFLDNETGERIVFDASCSKSRKLFEKMSHGRREEFINSANAKGIDCIPVTEGDDYVKELIKFFRKREKRQ
ncbi:MAG: DUF58 domain-containing protein [Planctomycetota bacterium]|jgi:uncharacterized protein (DUF58 family)